MKKPTLTVPAKSFIQQRPGAKGTSKLFLNDALESGCALLRQVRRHRAPCSPEPQLTVFCCRVGSTEYAVNRR